MVEQTTVVHTVHSKEKNYVTAETNLLLQKLAAIYTNNLIRVWLRDAITCADGKWPRTDTTTRPCGRKISF